MPDDLDPEILPPVEKIRYAEQLIRREHSEADADWQFWGNVADQLKLAVEIPQRGAPARFKFNRAQDMATGYIRMSAQASAARCEPLSDDERFRVQEARDILGTWDLARGPAAGDVYDRERVLADQVRALLSVIGKHGGVADDETGALATRETGEDA